MKIYFKFERSPLQFMGYFVSDNLNVPITVFSTLLMKQIPYAHCNFFHKNNRVLYIILVILLPSALNQFV